MDIGKTGNLRNFVHNLGQNQRNDLNKTVRKSVSLVTQNGFTKNNQSLFSNSVFDNSEINRNRLQLFGYATGSGNKINDPQSIFSDLMSEKKDVKINKLVNKVARGGVLTGSEREYLMNNNPEALQKAEEINRDRVSFERNLKSCANKEEAAQMYQTWLGKINSMYKSESSGGNGFPDFYRIHYKVIVEEYSKFSTKSDTQIELISQEVSENLS